MCFRCLTWHNTNVAEFLGIHNAEALTPAFVFNGDLKSVRKSLSGFCNRKECVPEILTGTACGLEYLHKKGLVHMELTQDTITVSNKTVQSLNSHPTHIHLPREGNVKFNYGRFFVSLYETNTKNKQKQQRVFNQIAWKFGFFG